VKPDSEIAAMQPRIASPAQTLSGSAISFASRSFHLPSGHIWQI
jgi:hypothetical protein